MIAHFVAFLIGVLLSSTVGQLQHRNTVQRHQLVVAALQSEHQEAAQVAAAAVRVQQDSINHQYQTALNEAIEAQNTLRADAGRARAQLDGLRKQTTAAAGRIAMPSTAPAAVAEYATTTGELLDHCGREYQELAEKADGHAADVRMMQQTYAQ